MTPWGRLASSLRRAGPTATAVKLWIWAADRWFDLRHGTDTCKGTELSNLTIPGENREHGTKYQPTRVLPLRKLLRLIQPLIPPDSVLLDLGCGKGRVLLVAAEFEFKKVRGVEFASELCTIARSNCAEYKSRTKTEAEFRIIEADVSRYEFQPDENILFLFNPFDEFILGQVLANLALSLRTHPRLVFIIYYNPRGAGVIEQPGNFTRLREHDFWGYSFVMYSNRGRLPGVPSA